jgi:hypothetical protein
MTKGITKAELHDFYMTDDTQYCCYCSEGRGSRLSCCQENHFVPFDDLYPEDQAALLEEMKDE